MVMRMPPAIPTITRERKFGTSTKSGEERPEQRARCGDGGQPTDRSAGLGQVSQLRFDEQRLHHRQHGRWKQEDCSGQTDDHRCVG